MAEILPSTIDVGVVGLGLMGSSIVVALLIADHPVKAVAPLADEEKKAWDHIKSHVTHCQHAGLLQYSAEYYLNRLTLSTSYEILSSTQLVLECVTEQLEIKKEVYQNISDVVADDTIIASNTSAIPISILQSYVPHPQRFLGIHWAEPAYMTRFLEITCGQRTVVQFADWVYQLAHHWGKEPTLLKKDIRGFVTNRLMYAIYREGLALASEGIASVEDMDKAFRYDAGSWMTLMGIFRRLDYLGFKNLSTILKIILPQLSNNEGIPEMMQHMIDRQEKGTQSGKGFYTYSGTEADEWEKAFAKFNKDIDVLAAQYPAKVAKLVAD